jgi:hypothetical protein
MIIGTLGLSFASDFSAAKVASDNDIYRILLWGVCGKA